jgi:LysM repeat protein
VNEPTQGRYALLIIFISFMLVIGSIITAFAETSFSPGDNQASSPTSVATDIVFFTLTNTAAPTAYPTETPLPVSPTDTIEPHTPTTESPSVLAQCDPPADWEVLFIEFGQTLEEIAADHQTTVEILIDGNCLSSTELLPGYIIFVPPANPTATPSSSQAACTPPIGWITYTVRSGDNLYQISKAFGITVPELQAANCMGSSTKIITGSKLWVPNVPTITPTATKTPKPPAPTSPPPPPAPNTPPVAYNDDYDVATNGTLIINDTDLGVLFNDIDDDLDPLEAIWISGPECATSNLILNLDGTFSYTVDLGVCTAASDSFTYVANDGSEDSNPAIVTLNFPPP